MIGKYGHTVLTSKFGALENRQLPVQLEGLLHTLKPRIPVQICTLNPLSYMGPTGLSMCNPNSPPHTVEDEVWKGFQRALQV